jgi:SAM-dependent methyltransferase
VNGTVASDSSVYYQSGYWNELPLVQRYLNRRATGDPAVAWTEHLAAYHGGAFDKALVLNCGNGWVERELVQAGLVKEAVGVDYSEDLLRSAREEAEKLGLPLRYAQLDTNSARWPEGGFDLVVNYAAGHHIAYLDRVLRSLAEMLPETGLLVSWDYVGPHRNQYPAAQWDAAWRLNRSLPDGFGHEELTYPHLPTMLHTDPTEAIHSELFLPVLRRYFELEYVRPLGGALAYPVLTFNQRLSARPAEESDPVVEQVLAADEAYTDADPLQRTLFAYVIARPLEAALADTAQLAVWTAEEDERERRGADSGGRYYPDTMTGSLYDALDRARREAEHAGQQVAALNALPTIEHMVQPVVERTLEQALGPALQRALEPALGPALQRALEPALGPALQRALQPPPRTGPLARLRANPRLRATAKRVPGARPAVLWLRRRRSVRSG